MSRGKWVEQKCTQGVMLKELHPRNPIYTWTWLRWWDSGLRWYSNRLIHLRAFRSSRYTSHIWRTWTIAGWKADCSSQHSTSWISHPHVLPSHAIPELICMTNSKQDKRQYHTSEIIKDRGFHLECSLTLSDHSLWESQVAEQPYGGRGPCDEWVKLPANRHLSVLGSESFRPSQTTDDCSPGWHLDTNLVRDPSQEPPSYAAPKFLTLRDYGGW